MVVTCILVLSLAVDINVVKMAYPGLDCGDDLYSGPITVDSCVVMMTCQGLDCGGLNCILVLSLAVDINVVMMTCPGLDCGGDLYPGPITVDTDVVKMTYTQVWIVVVTCILVLSLAAFFTASSLELLLGAKVTLTGLATSQSKLIKLIIIRVLCKVVH